MKATELRRSRGRLLARPPVPEAATPAVTRLLGLQRSAGNAAVGGLLQREAATATPHVFTIYGERVEVANRDEQEEAGRIIRAIQQHYGIRVHSPTGLAALRRANKDEVADAKTLDKVTTSTWKLKELEALELALAHFAPILGENRKQSSRKGKWQEVTTLSKLSSAVHPFGLDPTTDAETFRKDKNVSLYEAGTESKGQFKDNDEQLVGTAIHELAHGLMDYARDDWVRSLPFWDTEDVKSEKPGAEAPLNSYASANADEDLSESVAFFFLEPATLKKGYGKAAGEVGNPCPTRFSVVEKYVNGWKGKR